MVSRTQGLLITLTCKVYIYPPNSHLSTVGPSFTRHGMLIIELTAVSGRGGDLEKHVSSSPKVNNGGTPIILVPCLDPVFEAAQVSIPVNLSLEVRRSSASITAFGQTRNPTSITSNDHY